MDCRKSTGKQVEETWHCLGKKGPRDVISIKELLNFLEKVRPGKEGDSGKIRGCAVRAGRKRSTRVGTQH